MPIPITFLQIAPLKTAGVQLFPEQIQTVKHVMCECFANPPPCCKFIDFRTAQTAKSYYSKMSRHLWNNELQLWTSTPSVFDKLIKCK